MKTLQLLHRILTLRNDAIRKYAYYHNRLMLVRKRPGLFTVEECNSFYRQQQIASTIYSFLRTLERHVTRDHQRMSIWRHSKVLEIFATTDEGSALIDTHTTIIKSQPTQVYHVDAKNFAPAVEYLAKALDILDAAPRRYRRKTYET